jgi:RNA polymerase sigma factor (TIGR02999 family)
MTFGEILNAPPKIEISGTWRKFMPKCPYGRGGAPAALGSAPVRGVDRPIPDRRSQHDSSMTSRSSVTQLLHDWRSGHSDALERLTPLVYDELRRLAERYMKTERAGHTLQATAIVHEAYVRLIDMQIPWEDRAHFFSVAARLMRRILVDYAKTRRAEKRGAADITVFELKSHDAETADIGYDIVDIDSALTQLASVDPRLVQMVEIHYFAGLSSEETAAALGISVATLHRDLRTAKAWLMKAISKSTHDT